MKTRQKQERGHLARLAQCGAGVPPAFWIASRAENQRASASFNGKDEWLVQGHNRNEVEHRPRACEETPLQSSETRPTSVLRGFSLIELLVVIAIIAMLTALLAPAVSTTMRGSQLIRGGDKALAVLSLARQTALAKNQSVEVRFYQYGDPEVPGESANSPASGKFRAIQAFKIDDSNNATPVGKIETLPTSIIMDSGSTSTLLGSSQKTTLTTPPAIPRAGTSYNCCAFRFLADGSANLIPKTSTTHWTVTFHNIVDGDGRSSPPANFITIQIDPANGSLKTWQP